MFDFLNDFVRKRHKVVIVVWLLILIASAPLIASFFASVSFNVAGSNSLSVPNSESDRAQALLDAQFPSTNSSSNPIIVVFENSNVYSDSVKADILALNGTLTADLSGSHFTGIVSVYGEEEGLLDETVPGYLSQVALASAQAPDPQSQAAAWDAASSQVAGAVSAELAESPLFTVNSSSLYALFTGLNATSTPSQIRSSVANLVSTIAYADFPYRLSSAVTQNFVSRDNGTMLFELNFSSPPSNPVITQARSAVHDSSLSGLGRIYVTGGSVVALDFENAAKPALDDSILPGLAVSFLVAGLLFLSPVAALVPLLIGGLAVGISLASVYGLIVVVQHGQINFTVPFLMILTMLGLSVDYSVLQLRRTREERSKGKSIQDSVAVSVKWAGQAILTAGTTVVVAYVVLAITKVPFFGAVGTGIALGVAVLLAASLTLLPSLELLLGDRLFWPKGARPKSIVPTTKRSKLDRITEKTLQRKVAIAAVISLLALGALYVTYKTPSGFDVLKLLPNFESNQGLTAITKNLGGSVASPTFVLVTFHDPIAYGKDEFNQTQLAAVAAVTAAVSGSAGVGSTSSPTSPYGTPFNLSTLGGLSRPVQAQYLSGTLSQIGKDNLTALITVGLTSSAQSSTAVADLKAVEASVSALHLPAGTTVLFGGTTQSTIDTLALINGVLPLVLLILALGVYFILFAQLRSVFTPLRLIFTILCSAAFALALLAIIFYYALQTPIVSLSPLFVIVTMLGVGIDYDIFLVTRIREEAVSGKQDIEAIKTAVEKTWVTVFGLGLILSSVFASLAASGIGILAEIGISVASAVLVDVGVVILLFVPSLMAIAQKYNWWPGKVRGEGA